MIHPLNMVLEVFNTSEGRWLHSQSIIAVKALWLLVRQVYSSVIVFSLVHIIYLDITWLFLRAIGQE